MTLGAIIGLDVGGTKVAGGLLTDADELIELTQRPTLVDGRRDPGLAVTRQVAEELAGAAARARLELRGIGAGFPEYVDPEGRLSSREVLEWTSQPAQLLADIAPTTVDSDVRCASLGEGALGAARGLASYVYVIVGTGLSYALVENGQARSGARGEAIALGELEVSRSVDPGTELPLERYASGEGIRERFAAATGRDARGAADVFGSAASGDQVAGSIVATASAAVGAALATLVSIIDPGAIVIGGGVTSAGPRWRGGVESAYAARAGRRPSPPPLRWAELGSRAGIIGAAIRRRGRLNGGGQRSTA